MARALILAVRSQAKERRSGSEREKGAVRSDPVEAELQQMITDTVERQLHEKVAELTEAAAKAAMTAGQSYERIAEITQ